MNHIHPNLHNHHHHRRRSGRTDEAQGSNDNPSGSGLADSIDARSSFAPIEQSPPKEDHVSEYDDETDSLMNLFSSTLRSLVADAAAIRQLSDMADLLKEEQQNNIMDSANSSNSPAMKMAAELVRLDDLVTGFEHKVEVLRQIIHEESKALAQFETTLRQEADDQAALIEGLMDALQLYESDQPQQNPQQQQQQSMEHEMETQSQRDSETNDSFSSMGSSSIHNSIHDNNNNNNNNSYTRQSLANTIEDSGSWEEEDLMTTTATPTQRQAHVSSQQRSSVGSNASSITIRSNESGSFTRRSGLLRSTRFSSGNVNANNNNNTNANNHSTIDVSSTSRNAATHRKTSYKKTVVFQDVDASCDETNENNAQHSVDDPKQQPSFVPVTDQELGTQTLFGPHMCRYDINEALEEIQSVVWNQMMLLETSFKSRKSSSSSIPSKRQSGSSYRGQDSKHNNHSSSSIGNGGHRFCVSEQELRENCAFFKHGESTARSTLQLLCSLKRLKQVPSKKSEVTYVCLFGM